MMQITRRAFLRQGVYATAAVTLGGLGMTACKPHAEALETLLVQGPPSPPSLALLRLAEQGIPAELAAGIDFAAWSTADEMRARITSGQAQFSGLPVNVAATLYNRGAGVQLLNVYIWGILYLLTTDPEIVTWDDLRGETVLIPMRGDLPDIITQYLLQRHGMELGTDIVPSYLSAAPEAAQLLAAGQAKHAVLSEPSATLAVVKAQQNDITLYRAIDYSQAWAAATGRSPRLPMAGVVVDTAVAQDNPDVVSWFQQAHHEAAQWVADNPAEASELGVDVFQSIPVAVMQQSLPNIQFSFVEAADARDDIEFFLSELQSLSPDLIGGELPPDAFYYPTQA